VGKRFGTVIAAACVVLGGAGLAVPATAVGFVPAQTNWNVVRASGKVVWTLESVPFDYLGFRTASGEVTELWHYTGHGSMVTFPFTALRPLGPPGSPTYNFPLRPIKGTLSGHASGIQTDGTSGGCSSNLANLPNPPSNGAMLNMATIDKRHLAVWTTAEDPTDLLTTDPCATQLGVFSAFPAADPDQQNKPIVHETPISRLRIDPTLRRNRGKRVQLNLEADYDLVVTTTDGKRHVVGTEKTTAIVVLKLRS
jgi:hypothetical protein